MNAKSILLMDIQMPNLQNTLLHGGIINVVNVISKNARFTQLITTNPSRETFTAISKINVHLFSLYWVV